MGQASFRQRRRGSLTARDDRRQPVVQVRIKRSQCPCSRVPVSEVGDVLAVGVVGFVHRSVPHDPEVRRRDPSRQPAKEAELQVVTEVADVPILHLNTIAGREHPVPTEPRTTGGVTVTGPSPVVCWVSTRLYFLALDFERVGERPSSDSGCPRHAAKGSRSVPGLVRRAVSGGFPHCDGLSWRVCRWSVAAGQTLSPQNQILRLMRRPSRGAYRSAQ